jgi:hypothetical protein
MRAAWTLVALLLPSSWSHAPAEAAPRLGVAALHADGSACVTFRGLPMRSGERIWVILFSPPRVVDGSVGAEEETPCNRKSPTEGRSYTARLRRSMGDAEEVGIAVSSPGARVEALDGEFVLHTPGAKTPLSFRLCASGEGLHLTTWRGHRRTWHAYWYLGYDLEGDCSDEEVQESREAAGP